MSPAWMTMFIKMFRLKSVCLFVYLKIRGVKEQSSTIHWFTPWLLAVTGGVTKPVASNSIQISHPSAYPEPSPVASQSVHYQKARLEAEPVPKCRAASLQWRPLRLCLRVPKLRSLGVLAACCEWDHLSLVFWSLMIQHDDLHFHSECHRWWRNRTAW